MEDGLLAYSPVSTPSKHTLQLDGVRLQNANNKLFNMWLLIFLSHLPMYSSILFASCSHDLDSDVCGPSANMSTNIMLGTVH